MDSALPARIGRYEVIDRLGAGGMGVVYRARDPQLERTVAIKVLRIHDSDMDVRERFAREARSAGQLRHPNIVTIYDIGEYDERPFIAMEYVDGGSLAELIRGRAPIRLERKLQLIQQLCAGLGFAHRLGVIHRDIKPANLMMTADGDLKILDFGLARFAERDGITLTGEIMGTPNYMSPEQVRGDRVDTRADIFAVGLVMYELLTYQRAFNTQSVVELALKVVSTEVPSIREHLPDADPELERIVATATRINPDQRYQSIDELLRDLQRTVARSDNDDPPSGSIPRQLAVDVRAPSRPSGDAEGELDNLEVELLVSKGRSAAWKGDLGAAIALIDQALQLQPSSPAALELRRGLARQAAEAGRQLERKAALRRTLEVAKANLAAGSLDAARRAVLEALASDAGNEAALALKEEVNAALDRRDALAETADADTGRMPNTIAAAPPSGAPPAALVDHTVYIPSAAASPGPRSSRPQVRVTVVQCADARIVNQSFDVGESFEIGRESEDLRANDLSWSRRHAVIEYVNDGYAIRDLGSTVGTYVNGRRVRPNAREPLLFGARITIGSSLLVFSPVSDTRLPDLTGAVVANRYVLERLLRASSKGAVYAARQQTIPLRHALKLLSPTLLDYPGYRDRFKREAEVASDLHHPHNCEVQDYGETTITHPDQDAVNTAYLCLRLMTGGTLADRLDAREQISLPDIGRWIDSLADALAYAHARNVVHGDIKPTAVVFDDGGNVYLTDFAIGQPREGDSTPGVIGTPAYMAPEQWEGQASTRATDQFGLAALAYYMVAGVRPFEGQDNEEIRRRNFAHGPLAAHKEAALHARPELPAPVSDVLARGLAFGAGDRYDDLSDFAREFNEALRGRLGKAGAAANPRVFLSYQRAGGSGLSLFIVNQLEKHGIEVFLDVQRADGAVKFPERLTREIQKADVFVCLLGPDTLESRWVRQEIELASQHGKPMIPVFHEEFVVPDDVISNEVGELLSFDGIRLMDQQNLYVQEGIDKLAKQITDTVARRRSH
jgi:serine/threonine protein kinase